jgi:hypothetical protein
MRPSTIVDEFAFCTLDDWRGRMGMSSARQIETNRKNAQRSTGPRTSDGKSRVALNAVKHGLTAKTAVLPHEDPDEFEAFREAMFIDAAPQGAFEEMLVEKISADAWRLRRVPVLEAALHTIERERQTIKRIKDEVNRYKLHDSPSYVPPRDRQAYDDAAARLAEAQNALEVDNLLQAIQVLEKHSREFALLERREQALTRSLFKTLHELQRLQAKRAGEPVPAPAAVDVNVNISGDGAVNPE